MKGYFKKEIYNEEYSIPEFTMGFELEAWTDDLELKEEVGNVFYDWWRSNKDKLTMDLSTINLDDDPTIIPDDQKEDCRYCDGTGYIYSFDEYEEEYKEDCIYCDGRGYQREAYGDDVTYEWGSPVFNITPANLQKIVNFLIFGIDNGYINTNETCGFHIHLGFPDQSTRSMDMMWALAHLMMDEEQLNNILKFKNINLSDDTYAGFKFTRKFKKRIRNIQEEYKNYHYANEAKNYKYDALSRAFKDFYVGLKHRIIRQHSQGTFEWRGSRGFMDSGRPDDIKEFLYRKFYPFVQWINRKLDEQVLILGDTLSITKTEFYDMLKDVDAPSEYENMKLKNSLRRNNKFDRRQDMEIVDKIYKQFPQVKSWNFEDAHLNINGNEKLEIIDGIFMDGTNIDDCNIYGGDFKDGIVISNSTFLRNINLQGNVIIKKCIGDSLLLENYSNVTICSLIDCNFKDTVIRGRSEIEILDGTYNHCRFQLNVITKGGFYNDCIWETDPENWQGGEWHKGEVKILHPDGGNRNPLGTITDLNPIEAYKKFQEQNKYEDDEDIFEEYIVRGKK